MKKLMMLIGLVLLISCRRGPYETYICISNEIGNNDTIVHIDTVKVSDFDGFIVLEDSIYNQPNSKYYNLSYHVCTSWKSYYERIRITSNKQKIVKFYSLDEHCMNYIND